MRYLLDTNMCIYIAKRKPAGVLARFKRLRPGDVGMSIITYLELVYGAWNSQRTEANLAIIGQLRLIIPAQPLDGAAAPHYGRLRTELERKGRLMAASDLLVAAHALAFGLTLVANKLREFARV